MDFWTSTSTLDRLVASRFYGVPDIDQFVVGWIRNHLLPIRGRIIECGLFTEQELAALTDALHRHLDDPRTVVTRPPLFQPWGRKPD